MDNVNQPQGQGPQENPPTQPSRFTPGWHGGAQGGQGYGAPPGDPQWQQSGPPPQGPHGPQWQQAGPGPQQPKPKKDWKHSRRLRWTAGIAAAVLLGAGGAFGGVALASSGGSSGSNGTQAAALSTALSGTSNCPTAVSGTPSKTGKKGCLGLRRRLRRVRGMYGQIAFQTSNGTETLGFERGSVASFGGGKLVVKARNGTEWTWDVASSSIVRESGKPVSSSQLSSGANVFVGGQIVGSSKDARLIVIRKKQASGQSSSSSSSSSNSTSSSTT